jgi:hypothetical protein
MIFQTHQVISGLLSDVTQVSYFLRCSNQDITFYCYGVVFLGFVCLLTCSGFYYRVQKFVTSVSSVSVPTLLLFRHYVDMHSSINPKEFRLSSIATSITLLHVTII